MEKIGMWLIVAMIIGFSGVAGGVEQLPAEPAINDVVNLVGVFLVSLAAGALGVSLIKEHLE